MDTNTVIVAGRLTRDPELTYTKSQVPLCKFSIAVNGMKKDDAEDVSFFDITAWNKTAETCSKYLKKGSQLIVNGRLKQSRFQAKDGTNRSKVDIVANQVQFVGAKSETTNFHPSNDIPIPEPEWSKDGELISADVITGDVPF